LLDVTAFPGQKPNKKGTKKRREGFARSPADDAAEGVALFDRARDSLREKSRDETHEAEKSSARKGDSI